MNAFRTVLRRMNLRHFRDKRLRTLLTVSGVASGVMLVFSIGLINATLLDSVRSSVRELAGAAEIEVVASDQNGLPTSAARAIQGVDGVQRAVPVLRSTSRLRAGSASARPLVIGVTPDFGSLFPRGSGEFGRISITGGFGAAGGGLLLSQSVANDLGVAVGEQVRVETPTGTKGLEVTGSLGGSAIEILNGGRIGMMLLPAAQETFDRPNRLDSVYVITDRAASVTDVESRIETAVDSPIALGPPGERGEGFEEQVGSVSTLTSLAGTVALLVSVFVVFNTMSMSLTERRREISMGLALGAGKRQMFAAFMAEAAVLGTVASAAGLGGGYLLARALIQPVLDGFPVLPISGTNPVTVPGLQIAIAVIGGLGVSVLGAFIPARRILRVAPVEALRPQAAYEWDAERRHPTLGRAVAIAIAPLIASLAAAGAYITAFNDLRWLVNVSLGFGLIGISILLLRAVPFGIQVLRRIYIRFFGPAGRLSIDALQKNPGRTTFTVAALILTLGMVVGVASSLGSYEAELDRSAHQWMGAELYVVANSYQALGSDQPLAPETIAPFEKVDGVEAVLPVRYAFLDVAGEPLMVYAVPAARGLREGLGAISSVEGVPRSELIDGVSNGEVFIARYTAEERGWTTGDRIELPTPKGKETFTVGGVFDDLNSFQSMFIEHAVYARTWADDRLDRLAIAMEPGADPKRVAADLTAVARSEDIPARVLTQDETVGQLVESVEGLFQMARGVQFAALVVALLTIANTMFTAVLERRWEIALQRAIGMGAAQVSRSLFLETGAIGVVGGAGALIMGTATGFMMTQLMEAQYAWRIPYQTPFLLVSLSVVAGIVIALIAGALPNRMAVRAPIIESLRYE